MGCPALRTVRATKYVTPFREGGSLPGLVEADDDGLYVVKFHGAAQGPRALVAEVIAGRARRGRWGCRCRSSCSSTSIRRSAASTAIRGSASCSSAARASTLGLDFLPGSMTFNPRADGRPDPELAADVVWFDALVTNTDRSPRNPNILAWHRRLYLIDHGASLFIHHTWRDPDEHARRPLDTIADHVLLPFASSLDAAHARLAPLVTEPLLRGIVELVPGRVAPPPPDRRRRAAQRDAYVAYLLDARRDARGAGRCDRGAAPCRLSRSSTPSSASSPRVERGEGVNVGVVVFCRTRGYLGARVELGDRQRAALAALVADLDVDAIQAHLDEIVRIVDGDADGGPIAKLDAPERFRWVTSPSSTMIQPSEVHGGMTESPEGSLDDLFERLVR